MRSYGKAVLSLANNTQTNGAWLVLSCWWASLPHGVAVKHRPCSAPQTWAASPAVLDALPDPLVAEQVAGFLEGEWPYFLDIKLALECSAFKCNTHTQTQSLFSKEHPVCLSVWVKGCFLPHTVLEFHPFPRSGSLCTLLVLTLGQQSSLKVIFYVLSLAHPHLPQKSVGFSISGIRGLESSPDDPSSDANNPPPHLITFVSRRFKASYRSFLNSQNSLKISSCIHCFI